MTDMSTITPIVKDDGQAAIVPEIILNHTISELPPPYCEDDSDGDSEAEFITPDVRLSTNAEQVVRGSHNLVPINGTHVAHAAKISAMLLEAISQVNKLNHDTRRAMKVQLNINCGISVVGDRNIVGNFGVTPKVAQPGLATAATAADATAGAKRKRDDDACEDLATKRVST